MLRTWEGRFEPWARPFPGQETLVCTEMEKEKKKKEREKAWLLYPPAAQGWGLPHVSDFPHTSILSSEIQLC